MKSQNHEMYKNMPPEVLEEFATKTGINACIDLKIIQDYFLRCSVTITEYGSGYGRVIDYLLENTQARIIGVESQDHYVQLLREKYSNNPRVNIVQDIVGRGKQVILPKSDLVLATWGFLMEVHSEERSKIFHKAYNDLDTGGNFLVDLPKNPGESIAEDKGLELKIETDYGNWTTTFPTDEEMKEDSEKFFISGRTIPYSTKAGLQRNWKIFSNGILSNNSST